ncbi:cell division protein ZapD [Legionella sp. km772]|uniref:cell division protein ZapD n=1 Tax=Legionella sp. km772 TaxID=2498111 RepID=UPI000F8EB513|nr:cell division protein ZapD [Legionella sp. km772]RUR12944.1 cell division protein ZapD [Legionella sp. km772]
MYKDTITFQLATHFLPRIALRLEFLFKIINQAGKESHEVIHRYALKNIIELINIIEKPELKSRFIKELIRMEHVLKKLTPPHEMHSLNELEKQIHLLNDVPGRFSQPIHDDMFLKTLKQIYHPNTPECEFNSPHLVLWFDLDPLTRQKMINLWLHDLRDLESTVIIYLSLLRTMTEYHSITACNGFYQHSFAPKTTNHLILLKMDKSLRVTPQLQLGHNNLTIRLYESNSTFAVHDRAIEMEIAFCQI